MVGQFAIHIRAADSFRESSLLIFYTLFSRYILDEVLDTKCFANIWDVNDTIEKYKKMRFKKQS